jgi:protein tyrosine phosphatase
MFVWLTWAFIFFDFRLLALSQLLAEKTQGAAQIGVPQFPSLPKNPIFKGFIGCLYSKVCSPEEECANDNLFGRCIPKGGEVFSPEIQWVQVSADQNFLTGLEKLMRNLWVSGFTWHDLLTQCIVRTTLYSYKMKAPVDLRECEPYVVERRFDSGKRSEEPIRVHKYAPPSLDDLLTNRDRSRKKSHMNDESDDSLPDEVLVQLMPFLYASNNQEVNDMEPTDDRNDELRNYVMEEEPLDYEETDMENLPQTDDTFDDQMKYLQKLVSLDGAISDKEHEGQTIPKYKITKTKKALKVHAAKDEKVESKRVTSHRLYQATMEDSARVVDRSYVSLRVEKTGQKLNESLALVFLREMSKRLGAGVEFDVDNGFDVKEQEITFRVPEYSSLQSNEIVEILRNNTKFVPGYEIQEVAYGTRSNQLASSDLHPHNDRLLLTVILCATVLAAVTIVLIIFFVQRHRFGNKKAWIDYSSETTVPSVQPVFYGGSGSSLVGADTYRDLCRQHAQSKAMEETMDSFLPEHTGAGKSEDSNSPRNSTSSWTEEPAQSNMDISTGHAILSYMEEHLNKKDKLEAEWQTMVSYEPDTAQIAETRKEINAPKNRYIDAVPYDHCRVKLQNPSSNGTDYINASFIVDHDPKVPLYIATQGPLVNTVVDFWQMVWEQNCVIVVNLSCLIEAGVPMCQKYWPEEGSQIFDKFEVHLVSEHVWCEEYLVRSFYLKNLHSNETRTITQFHFIAWPDLDVPTSARSLLEFRRKVNKSFRHKTSPIVIHCSDGCGRTGTYILLDMILTRLARGVKEVDVAAALEHIRDQRMDMVKTRDQFEFVLLCIAEEVQSILKVMSS